jgi:hypothetical protein
MSSPLPNQNKLQAQGTNAKTKHTPAKNRTAFLYGATPAFAARVHTIEASVAKSANNASVDSSKFYFG